MAAVVSDFKRDPWHWWTSGGTERDAWAATSNGFWKHENFPFGTWVNVIDLDTIAAHCPRVYAGVPTVLENGIYRVRMAFSAEVPGRWAAVINAGFSSAPAGSSCWAAMFQDDAFLNDGDEISVSGGGNDFGYGGVCFAPHGGGNRAYACSNRNYINVGSGLARLWYTVNAGGTWGGGVTYVDEIQTEGLGINTQVAIPYISPSSTDKIVAWGRGQGTISSSTYRITTDGGATWAVLPGSQGPNYAHILMDGTGDGIALVADRPDVIPCKWSNDQGATWHYLPLLGVAVDQIGGAFAEWAGSTLQRLLIGGGAGEFLWENGRPAWVLKTGSLFSVAPDLTSTNVIDRDSMGTA